MTRTHTSSLSQAEARRAAAATRSVTSASETRSWACSSSATASKLGTTVKLDKVRVTQKLPTVPGQKGVEAVGPHELKILSICRKEVLLIGATSYHIRGSLGLITL